MHILSICLMHLRLYGMHIKCRVLITINSTIYHNHNNYNKPQIKFLIRLSYTKLWQPKMGCHLNPLTPRRSATEENSYNATD